MNAIINEHGTPVCKDCKDPKAEAEAALHVDYSDRFSRTYQCACGNAITVMRKRHGVYTQEDIEGVVTDARTENNDGSSSERKVYVLQ